MAKARHFKRVRYDAASFFGEILEIGRRVVMRHQHGILLRHHALNGGNQSSALGVVEMLLLHGRSDNLAHRNGGHNRNGVSAVHGGSPVRGYLMISTLPGDFAR